ncbi:PAS domain S-box protein [Piscinibacter sakaiensis]|uniref:PAS domain-containing protein n=1 Tax=Piscinibacter sakaiensis TaxID=1547922 RepID=UPI0037274035
MAGPGTAAPAPLPVTGEVVNALIRLHWESPFPVILQDAAFRVVDLNAACQRFLGYPPERLIGRDPAEFMPPEDRSTLQAQRRQVREELLRSDVAPVQERRLVDADGRERWARVAGRALRDDAGRLYYLSMLQDTTAEHVARERADGSARELDDWFVLSPVGMLLYDDAGRLVRSNPAFQALVGALPATLDEAPAPLQHLLAWEERVGARRSPESPAARRWSPRAGSRWATAASATCARRCAAITRRTASRATWRWWRTAARRRSATSPRCRSAR